MASSCLEHRRNNLFRGRSGKCRHARIPPPFFPSHSEATSAHECTLHSVPGRRPRERRAAFHRRFQKVGMVNHLAIVPNVEDSIEYLKGTGVYSNRIYYPFPGLLITDLKMSKRTGFDFLA
jgi:hypothetical protein